ncbi:MAG: winged helix DNA-binding domain-containing protein [Candidatus Limnocylindrales bacterium]
MNSADPPILSLAALNRATLARQHLLERAPLDPVAAIEALGGLQAQEPASPSIALWTRLADVRVQDLDAAIARRELVKATLMRSTLHLVSAADYRRLRPVLPPRAGSIRRQDRRAPPDGETLAALLAATAQHAREPRTLAEITAHLAAAGIEPDRDPADTVWWVRRHAPLIHAPGDVPWSFGRRPRLVDAGAWLGTSDDDRVGIDHALEHMVRRYLGAFGPATAADIGAWSGVAIGTLRPAIAELDVRDELWHARDERGRALLDLPNAPRPHPDIPVAPRLLAMWDSILLAHADRTRIISDADRAVVIALNGDTLPTFLVDGRVAGLWWAQAEPGGRTRIAIEPFRPVDPRVRQALEAEVERLAAFVEPFEPGVYGRYRRWRPTEAG